MAVGWVSLAGLGCQSNRLSCGAGLPVRCKVRKARVGRAGLGCLGDEVHCAGLAEGWSGSSWMG